MSPGERGAEWNLVRRLRASLSRVLTIPTLLLLLLSLRLCIAQYEWILLEQELRLLGRERLGLAGGSRRRVGA